MTYGDFQEAEAAIQRLGGVVHVDRALKSTDPGSTMNWQKLKWLYFDCKLVTFG